MVQSIYRTQVTLVGVFGMAHTHVGNLSVKIKTGSLYKLKETFTNSVTTFFGSDTSASYDILTRTDDIKKASLYSLKNNEYKALLEVGATLTASYFLSKSF